MKITLDVEVEFSDYTPDYVKTRLSEQQYIRDSVARYLADEFLISILQRLLK